MLDIIFAIVIVIALFKGYKKGLIIAIFSLVALIVGIAVAVKLSAAVASYFQPPLMNEVTATISAPGPLHGRGLHRFGAQVFCECWSG